MKLLSILLLLTACSVKERTTVEDLDKAINSLKFSTASLKCVVEVAELPKDKARELMFITDSDTKESVILKIDGMVYRCLQKTKDFP